MTKVHGKRYAYKFDFHGLMAACQAQAQPEAGTMMAYSKYHHHAHLAHVSSHPSTYHPYHSHPHLHAGASPYNTIVPDLATSSAGSPVVPGEDPSSSGASKVITAAGSSPASSSNASPMNSNHVSPILYNYWPYSPQPPPPAAFDPRPPPSFWNKWRRLLNGEDTQY